MTIPDRQIDPPEPREDKDIRRTLNHVGPLQRANLLSEACGADAWAESPICLTLGEVEKQLWDLLTAPLKRGEHPEYGKFDDAAIGRLIRIHAADYLLQWAERQ